jgi:hypothetical protein
VTIDRIDRRVFDAAVLDSAAVGPLVALILAAPRAGRYQLVGTRGRNRTTTSITVVDAPEPMHAEVDLTAPVAAHPTVSSRGAIVVYASTGRVGWQVVLTRASRPPETVLESSRLPPGSHVTFVPIRIGEYVVATERGPGNGRITVRALRRRATAVPPATVNAVLGADGLQPDVITLAPGQPLVVRLEDASRLTVEPR